MATIQITRVLLECDGCATQIGGPGGVTSPTEIRAQAYVAGWRFPQRIGKNGKPITRTSDVCPDCLPDWKPQTDGLRIRSMTRAEQNSAT